MNICQYLIYTSHTNSLQIFEALFFTSRKCSTFVSSFGFGMEIYEYLSINDQEKA